jgi:protein translocase SecG subunit
MSFLNFIWLVLNIILIVLILIRSPSEQSLQEILNPLKIFHSSGSAEKNLDNLIQVLILCYFILGFLLTSKAF